MTILIVVESPGKIDKISKMLGDEYKVVASFGHIQDLDPKTLSIDVTNNYEPFYIIPPEKAKVVQNLRYNNSQCNEVIIASDLDREGEMIGYSSMDVLKLVEPKRIVFNEITKKAILSALENPLKINMDMVYAQQTRRLLDRLVGYKISPLLWRNLDLKSIELSSSKTSKGGLSAGRVQSVVVRIINDLENEITKYQSDPYFKATATFNYNSIEIPCTLMQNKTIYHIENKDKAIDLLNIISENKAKQFIVTNVTNNEGYKSPPPPHITSSLMQEASTRHGMSSKKTMEVAQKLYEAGHITYMRTDSTVLSNEAVGQCKKYIEAEYGEKYYTFRPHKTNSVDAQEAHEAIRPTKVDVKMIDMGDDAQRLYTIIWKRTVASLMTSAKINTQMIEIDLMKKESLLALIFPHNIKFTSNFETIIFDGYLILSGKEKKEDSETDETILTGNIEITKDTVVIFDKIDISEEYTKPPLRYNEAGLIKILKKMGIGRPSTYASIISKIVERNYVCIQNIEGIKKEVVVLSLTKSFAIKEKSKSIVIGKENMKITPTPMGIQVNNFMMTHFAPIMDIKFTAEMEKMLDTIANGKAKWYNVLDIYYKLFSPMVEVLEKTTIVIKNIKCDDKMIGMHPTLNIPIFLTKAKFGLCIKITEDENIRYASIGDTKQEDITLDKALEFLEYPKYLGKIGTSIVTLNKGKYGLYFKIGTKIIGVKDGEPTLEHAKVLADSAHDSNTFKIKNKTVVLKNGQYGYYLAVLHGTKKPTNIPVPKKIDINTITSKIVSDIIDNYKGPKV